MLLTTEITIKLNGCNFLSHLESLGYTIPYFKNKDYHIRVVPNSFLTIKTEHLPSTSGVKVEVMCDYCNDVIMNTSYKDYRRTQSNEYIQKDCCKKCSPIKQKEISMKMYGVTTHLKLQSTKDRIKETNLKTYGVIHPMQLQSTKDKVKETNLERFGCEYPLQNEEIKLKIQQTNLERYGFITPLLNEDIIVKTKASNQLNYGCDNVFQNKEIKDKIRKSLYENNTAPCSSQQKYLHNLLGGKLNFPIGKYSLDIAFLDEKIYLEYDGSGHSAQVKSGNITEEEMITIERKRYYFLKNRGWSGIRFISLKNRFPSDEIIIDLINKAKSYIKTGHSWFEIDIDNNELRCSEYTENFNFEKLKWIKKFHVERQGQNLN